MKGAIDQETRCKHYHSERDIVALKFYCCGNWYPCYCCHNEFEDHDIIPWPKDKRSEKAVRCGACGYEMTIDEYFSCGSVCPHCKSQFNPKCAMHTAIYFET